MLEFYIDRCMHHKSKFIYNSLNKPVSHINQCSFDSSNLHRQCENPWFVRLYFFKYIQRFKKSSSSGKLLSSVLNSVWKLAFLKILQVSQEH